MRDDFVRAHNAFAREQVDTEGLDSILPFFVCRYAGASRPAFFFQLDALRIVNGSE